MIWFTCYIAGAGECNYSGGPVWNIRGQVVN